MDIEGLQKILRWKKEYSKAYLDDRRWNRDLAHALLHITKAVGKLFVLVDEIDHGKNSISFDERSKYQDYLADIVISAIRAANVFPGGAIGLEGAIARRAFEKGMLETDDKTCESSG